MHIYKTTSSIQCLVDPMALTPSRSIPEIDLENFSKAGGKVPPCPSSDFEVKILHMPEAATPALPKDLSASDFQQALIEILHHKIDVSKPNDFLDNLTRNPRRLHGVIFGLTSILKGLNSKSFLDFLAYSEEFVSRYPKLKNRSLIPQSVKQLKGLISYLKRNSREIQLFLDRVNTDVRVCSELVENLKAA